MIQNISIIPQTCQAKMLWYSYPEYPVVILLILILSFVKATTITIPQDYSTIQEGIDETSDGDTVLVMPGIYNENINFIGKEILVLSTDSQDLPIIHGVTFGGSVVRFVSGETSSTVLDGFIITGGVDYSQGGGITCIDSSPTLKNIVITDNQSEGGHGAIYALNSDFTIVNGTIVNNFSFYNTAVGILGTSQVTITNSIIWYNLGISIEESANLSITYSNISFDSDGEGNINENPQLVNPYGPNFNLLDDSPCIDTGNPDLDGDGITWEYDIDDQDPDGTRMDMGAFYFDQTEPDVLLSFGEIDTINQILPIYFESITSIWGFSFELTGIEILDAFGGSAEEAFFMIGASSNFVLGFSLDYVIPPGQGTLVIIEYSEFIDHEICFNELTFSGPPNGESLLVEPGPCIPTDYCTFSGDINNDSILDVLDIILTVNCILSEDICPCSDLNEDGIVDVLDIIMMVEEIVGD